MARVSDLVQDAELQTHFHPEYTTHFYIETGTTVRQRAILREDNWKRHRKPVGKGSYGCVWLEQCERENGQVEFRAVKEVDKCPHNSKPIDYRRELEAIMKFSHKNVGWNIHCHCSFGDLSVNDETVRKMLCQIIWLVRKR